MHIKEEFLRNAFISKLDVSKDGLLVETFAEKGAPLVTRYLQLGNPEGYIYVIVDNKDPEAIYKETLEFEKFDKMEMCNPHKG